MGRMFLIWVRQRVVVERITLLLALIIGLILAIAAWGKFFHPAESVQTLDQWISGFEVLFLLAIIFFRKQGTLWTVSAVVFASWFGYALYWYFLQLPCSCMGEMLDIPTVFSISLDLLFFISSLIAAYLLKIQLRWIYMSVLSGFMAGLVGYAFADWVYNSIVL